jgi:hypothetical protein
MRTSSPKRSLCDSTDRVQVPYNPQANSSGGSGPDVITASRLDRIESVLSVVLRHHGGIWGYKDVRDWMNRECGCRDAGLCSRSHGR